MMILRSMLLCAFGVALDQGEANPALSHRLPDGLVHLWKDHPLVFLPVTTLTLLGVFAALREAFAKWFIGEGAGALLSNFFAIISYRKALAVRYGKAHLPFRPEKPIDVAKIYVPLTAVTGFDSVLEGPGLDAEAVLHEYRRVMILAPPGGGKSMLLRHIATQYSAIGMKGLRHLRVPILFELHRLNGNPRPLIEQLADRLKGADVKPGFWVPRKFVEKGLRDGRLLILLDGLDEVDSSQRPRALSEIRELLQERCNVAITSRSAVYNRELDAHVDRVARIRAFDNDQVATFLERWETDKDVTGPRRTERLLRILNERPQLRALARNPLLLTIIAFLHIDKELSLPHSRAEFYHQATTELLRGWKPELNVYLEIDKRRVLESMATANLEDWRVGEPRLTIDRETALAVVRNSAPSVSDASGLLDEIVKRSGLLTVEESGAQFRWVHLTFREYFAAEALQKPAGGIAADVLEAPERWNETAKLWCGLAKDASSTIRAILPKCPTLALECCSEAAKIENSLYLELLPLIETGIGTGIPGFEMAAGTLAARPGAGIIFEGLRRLARMEDDKTRLAAAVALSNSNLDDAAKELALLAIQNEVFLPPLLKMGTQAVSALFEHALAGSANAASMIADVGGRFAAEKLVDLLDRANRDTAVAAAWGLAYLSADPTVESALRQANLSSDWPDTREWAWVWSPFAEGSESPLGRIMSRVAFLICSQTPPERLSAPKLDPRLVVPLCTVIYGDTLRQFGDAVPLHSELIDLDDSITTVSVAHWTATVEETWRPLLQKTAAFQSAPQALRAMLVRTPPSLEYDLIWRVSKYRAATQLDWERVLDQERPDWVRLFRVPALGVLTAFIVASVLLTVWIGAVLLITSLALFCHVVTPWIVVVVFWVSIVWFLKARYGKADLKNATADAADHLGCLFIAGLGVITYCVFSLATAAKEASPKGLLDMLVGSLSWLRPTQFGFWLLLAGAGSWWLAKRVRDRRARINPLYGVLPTTDQRSRVLRWRLAPAPERGPFITLSLRKSA